MYKDILLTITGIDVFPVISLVLFVGGVRRQCWSVWPAWTAPSPSALAACRSMTPTVAERGGWR